MCYAIDIHLTHRCVYLQIHKLVSRTHRRHYQQALILIAGSISLQLKGPEVLLSTQQCLEVGDLPDGTWNWTVALVGL